jgi:amino acid transporter
MITVNIGIGVIFLTFLGPTSFPGGSLVFGTVLATIGTLVYTLTWAFLSASMPRMGGDYIYLSRIVHPLIGFISNWSMVIFTWLFDVVAIYLLITDALDPSLFVLGVQLSNPGLVSFATTVSSQFYTAVIGFIMIAVLTIIVLVSTRLMMKLFVGVWIVAMIGTIATLVGLLTPSSVFVSNLNSYAMSAAGIPNYYSYILQTGSAGFVSLSEFSFQTVQIIPIAFFALGYAFYSTYLGSEIKNASRTQQYGVLIPVVVSGAFMALLAWAFQNSLSYQFLYASTNLYFTNSTAYALPSPPYINYMAMIGGGNVILTLLVLAGFVAWTLLWTANGNLGMPRNMMAWSFDRLGPAALASVNDRFHTPHWSIILAGIFHGILFVLTFTIGSFILGLTAVLGNIIFTFIPISIAVILFPYRNKAIYDIAPGIVKSKIGNLPILVPIGIMSLFFLALNAYLFAAYPIYGAVSPPALETMAFALVTAIIWFYAWKYYRLKQGIDLSIIFKVIPPE